jgi:hypothetical protein
MSQAECQSDPQWAAMRYLEGTLSVDEVASFEARLAEDVQLAEALADAVLLSAAVRAAEAEQRPAQPAVTTVRPSRRRRTAAVAATAAAAVLMLALQIINEAPPAPIPPAAAPTLADPSVLAVWATLADAASVPDFDPDPDLSDLELDHVSAVPDWMFAALATDQTSGAAEEMADPLEEQPL